MKTADVCALIKAAVRCDRNAVTSIATYYAESQRRANRHGVADEIMRTVHAAKPGLAPLPGKQQESLIVLQPRKTLGQLRLTSDVRHESETLIREWQLREALAQYELQPRNRILLYGPSGNGKTSLAEAIASELGLPLAIADYSSLIDSYRGKSAKQLSGIMKWVASNPCVLLFDEADGIGHRRTNSQSAADSESNLTVNSLLMELDRLDNRSLVIFATNFDGVLDPALKRRIQLSLELPAPSLGDMVAFIRNLKESRSQLPWNGFAIPESVNSYAELEEAALQHVRLEILSRTATGA